MSLINLAQSPDTQRGAAHAKALRKITSKRFSKQTRTVKKQINNKWKPSKKEITETEKNIKTICMGTAACGVFLASLVGWGQ